MLSEDGKLQYVTIPYPGSVPRQRGIHAINHNRCKMHIDFTIEEFNAIAQAAQLVGITKSEYIRWVGGFAAKEIINAQVHTEPVSTE